MNKLLTLTLISSFLIGCAAISTDDAIYSYKNTVQYQVKIGDSKSRVLSYLEPLHSDIPSSWLRPPEQFTKDGNRYYIHFQRTGRIGDGRLTDDELTPYIFANDELVAIGWTALGGPKSFGQTNTNDLATSLALIELGNSMMTGNTGTNTNSYGTSSVKGHLTGSTTSGFNKICYYNKVGSTYSLNIPNTSICPLTH